MIQRSGLSARSFSPMSAATARTCSTLVLSSVSGMVKNWGAWGSIAPPITVDIMAVSHLGKNYRSNDGTTRCERNEERGGSPCDRLHRPAGRKYLRHRVDQSQDASLAVRHHATKRTKRSPHGRGA